jgi:rubrerythrin
MQKSAPRKAPEKKTPARSRGAARVASRPATGIDSVAEFYAHAIAIEREAGERYRDLAGQMRGFGNQDTAKLFDRLAGFEEKHAVELKKKSAGMKLPKVAAGAWEWLDAGPTEVPRYEFLFRRVYTHHVLLLSLKAERSAKEFFERIRGSSTDPGVKKLAAEFAREEAEHMSWIEQQLEREAQKPKPAEEVQ